MATDVIVIVIGAPFYNFSIPTQLKAWVDRLAQPGRTFTYNETGPVGLATGKTVIVASTRGGAYSTSEGGQAMEHRESYLKVVFTFFGITDVRVVRAEGLALDDAPKAAALSAARRHGTDHGLTLTIRKLHLASSSITLSIRSFRAGNNQSAGCTGARRG